ncbi:MULTISPECIES: maleylacetoacetate isomerase [Thalassotalea]|uniref:Maleylacetoacetate isomerase n=1 Tax=Thalassotalea castellviae TaxID=3075612 RepID=A0ABU2ZY58_9GAMM|nr:maleylacetoacetate isomerase [Thalassotalea sp. W431]MDT0602639.1 maleylacetoacetate isomerase [Thalassotalea sp. W431]
MKLYGYWRSSAAYRVRIALNLKNIDVELIPVHLINNGGEQHESTYVNLNPTHLVPTLVDGDLVLNQSLAIIEYLDNQYPVTPLFPNNYAEKAIVQGLTLDIACEIHPVNNLRVQQYLVNELHCDEQAKLQWSHYWMATGFTAIEKKLAKTAGLYCFADSITIADLCLIPQVYNAKRFNLDMTPFPLINGIVDRCNQLPAFIKALPENQPDAV